MMTKGAKRFTVSESNPDSAFRNKRIMAGSSFDANRAEPSQGQSTDMPPLDAQRAASSRQHVRALNTQFASWVQTQLKNHPDELWEDGVRHYLTHASNILDKFSDVVNWLKVNAAKGENTAVAGSCTTAENKMVPESTNNDSKLFQAKSMFSPVGATNSFATSWSSGVFSNNHSSTGIFPSSQSLAGVSSNSQSSSEVFGSQCSSGVFSTQNSSVVSGSKKSSGVSSAESSSGVFGSQSSTGIFPSSQSSAGVSFNNQSSSGVFSSQIPLVFSSSQSPGISSNSQSSGLFSSSQSSGSDPKKSQSSGIFFNSQSSPNFSNTPSFGLFSNGQSSGLSSNSQSSAAFSITPSFGLFSNSQSSGLSSNSPPPGLFGFQSSVPTKPDASDEANGEDDLEQPSSPSVKKSEEKGVVAVHEVKCKLYVKSSDPADKDAWKDKGTGQLSIKCKEGVSKGTKESKPTIIVRNDVGRVQLNALLYSGIKTNLQKNSVVAIFHTAAEGDGNDGSNNESVVARTFLIRLKTEEDRNKLAMAIQEYSPAS